MAELHLIYGDDEAAINETKIKLVNKIIPQSERDQNLSEYEQPANRPTLSLKKILPALLAELSTRSLFGGSKRVVVVHNLESFYKQSSSGDGKALEALLDFLEHKFPSTDNVLIFVCLENPDRGRWVMKSSPLFALIKKIGSHRSFRSNLRQTFISSVLDRDTVKAIEDMRQWWSRTKSPPQIFNALVSTIELLMQAKLYSDRDKLNLSEKTLKENYLKRSMTVSLFREYATQQKRFLKASQNFTLKELTDAIERLLEINVFIYPRQSDKYVPDIQTLLEKFVIEFTGGKKLKVK